jgi:hypothetical protein
MYAVLLLFFGTLMALGLLGALLFTLSRENDKPYADSGLTGNQWRLLAWLGVIVLGLLAAVIEFFVLVKR